MYNLSDHQVTEVLKWNFLATPLLVFSLAASKISICLLLLRVLKQTRGKLKRYFPYAIIAILTIIAAPSAGYSLGQCHPVSKLWNPTSPGHCYDPRIYVKLGYANGCKKSFRVNANPLFPLQEAEQYSAINAICDFALALFPMTFVKDLHLPIRRKIVLGLLMSCGVV